MATPRAQSQDSLKSGRGLLNGLWGRSGIRWGSPGVVLRTPRCQEQRPGEQQAEPRVWRFPWGQCDILPQLNEP